MKKRILVIIGFLWILAALCILGKNMPEVMEYVSFDRQQEEVIHSFVRNKEILQNQTADPRHTIPDLGIDFTALQQLNPDIIGWIYIPTLEINDPILLGSDNEEYLHKNYLHEDQYLGSIFAHYQTSPLLDEPYTVLFGHNMKSGRMFGNLSKYQDKAFRDANPFVYIYTPKKRLQCTVYACKHVNASDPYVYTTGYEFGSPAFRDLIDYTVSNAMYSSELSPTDTDQVFCLSTCAGGGRQHERFTVFCVVTAVEE